MEDLEQIEQDAIQAAIDNKWEEAIKLNKSLLKYGNKSVATYNRLGKAFGELNMWDDAVKAFENALIKDPVNNVATKGLYNAKMDRKAGTINTRAHEETILRDLNTSQIIEVVFNTNVSPETNLVMVPNNKGFYMLTNSETGEKIKRISNNKLNLKQDAILEELQAKIIEYIQDNKARVKLTSRKPIFKSIKQEVEPSVEMKSKDVLAEKKEISKIMDEHREEEQ